MDVGELQFPSVLVIGYAGWGGTVVHEHLEVRPLPPGNPREATPRSRAS